MGAPFDTLAASGALEAAGMDPRQAKACAARPYAAGEAVTRPELNAALAEFKAEMTERFGEINGRFGETDGRIAGVDARISDLRAEMMERFAAVDERMTAQNWRLFGGVVAVAGLAVAAAKYLP